MSYTGDDITLPKDENGQFIICATHDFRAGFDSARCPLCARESREVTYRRTAVTQRIHHEELTPSASYIAVSPHDSYAKGISERAWLCAYVLAYEYPRRLTIAQRIECEIALMRGPDDAPLEMIALAADVMMQVAKEEK